MHQTLVRFDFHVELVVQIRVVLELGTNRGVDTRAIDASFLEDLVRAERRADPGGATCERGYSSIWEGCDLW